MNVVRALQTALDRALLPEGITSHHLRRVETDVIGDGGTEPNRDEYVVFRLVSSRQGAYGDGKAGVVRQYIDVNYYYRCEKTDARYQTVTRRVENAVREILSDPRFRLSRGQSDLYDIDNPRRGINVEFLFVGVAGDA